ncbi:LysR family transcriptional regulator [Aromatoleum anaerobium]|uniref:LysR family transcriptional regulator n=1 Tax=Aromatoleum anaerobium TaxID=182180 RepID=A0ABX1PKM3_9RHOO|nr:LysR family transcriptional regulator [Aromatoleum anaerobium]MCK0507212.1 LysR family transcriptional regulator [Aromatoleum anaerobium]
MHPINFRHLYYFWVASKEGGIARAAERLDMAIQTVSTQVRELEHSLGHALFRSAGRGVELTEAGTTAVRYAEQIFQLAEALPEAVREAAAEPGIRLSVGIADSLPKLAVRHLLQPAVQTPGLRLLCHESSFDDLLADLARHRLDVVLADRPAPTNPNLRVFSHRLGKASLAWYAPATLLDGREGDFPACLAHLPLLLPTTHSAVRARLDDWLARHAIRPKIVGEFEDSALLATFGESGLGAFPAPEWSFDELPRARGLTLLGRCPDVVEHFYAILAHRKVEHPVVRKLLLPAERV